MEHRTIEEPQGVRSGTRVALLVDGDKISSDFAGQVLMKAGRLGQVIVKRVYLDPHHFSNWERSAGFDLRVVRAGKNAADIVLAMDGVDLSHRRGLAAIVIVSSDGGFAPLARLLVERGLFVLGLGTATAPGDLRKSCSRFEALILPAPMSAAPQPAVASVSEVTSVACKTSDLDGALAEALFTSAATIPAGSTSAGSPASPPAESPTSAAAKSSAKAAADPVRRIVRRAGQAGVKLTELGKQLSQKNITCASLQTTSWRSYLAKQPEHYALDPKGPAARVRWIGA